MARPLAWVALALLTVGCASGRSTTSSDSSLPAVLLSQARPIGRGPAFHPSATGPVLGRCEPRIGPRFGVHVEVFARNRVMLVAAGIGIRSPLRVSEGRITSARCYGSLVTVEPTGVVLVRPGAAVRMSDLFRSWGQPLSSGRIASFAGPVRAYVGGRRVTGPPESIPLTRHAEIVLEVGPYVPPHAAYTFPPGA